MADYNATKNPPHKTGDLPTTCENCHNPSSWLGRASFDHNVDTSFPLTGSHTTTACLNCHVNGVYKGLPTACVSCHQADFNATTNPHHAAAGFSTVCSSCHTTQAWPLAPFDHNTTAFPLTGAHVGQTCINCHADKVYKGKPTTCISCHQTDYNSTDQPNHVTSGFPTTCLTCHTTTQWMGATFNHNTTAFPLTGAHKTATCSDCHGGGVYRGLQTGVRLVPPAGVRRDDESASRDRRASRTSARVVTPRPQWPGAPYNHNATAFPLTGAHVRSDVHQLPRRQGLQGETADLRVVPSHGLQQHDDAQALDVGLPDHLPDAAIRPRSGRGRSSTTIRPTFPLTGAHLTATLQRLSPRAACTRDCQRRALHATSPSSTRRPIRTTFQAGFSNLCASCHTTTKWPGATVHHSLTAFPLTGAHVGKTCISCHADKVYKGKPQTCVVVPSAPTTTTPRRPSTPTAGFPTTCDDLSHDDAVAGSGVRPQHDRTSR